MFSCSICNKEFSTPQKLGGHISSHNRKKKDKKPTIKICKYCDKEFENGWKLGAHIINCIKNPNFNTIRKNRALSKTGTLLSDSTKEKISNTIKEKVERGNWHLSFSKSRTYKYRGSYFHGKWELEYAKWLDKNNIKWRRPTEQFQYQFGKIIRYYTPDFYLIDEGIYVEIKGYPTDKDFAKWDSFPLPLKLLNGADLYSLGLIKSFRKVNRTYKGKTWQ